MFSSSNHWKAFNKVSEDSIPFLKEFRVTVEKIINDSLHLIDCNPNVFGGLSDYLLAISFEFMQSFFAIMISIALNAHNNIIMLHDSRKKVDDSSDN